MSGHQRAYEGRDEETARTLLSDWRPDESVAPAEAVLPNLREVPAAFAAITSPVLMLHGSYDPHPGKMIRDSLAPHLYKLEYREFERCGHSPWIERFARDNFFATLRSWLSKFCHT